MKSILIAWLWYSFSTCKCMY